LKRHLNTLFVTTQGAYLSKDGEAVRVRVEGKTVLRVPLHNLGGIVTFGNVACSPFLMGFCGDRGVSLSFLSRHGRFLARIHGRTTGNVLLRREQYRRAEDGPRCAELARGIVVAKIANCRSVLGRAMRDHPELHGAERIQDARRRMAQLLCLAQRESDLDSLRGLEGSAGRVYFSVFGALVVHQKEDFPFSGRSRRPPLDNVNALLSFVYTLVRHDVASALESAGLDPQVGFLHRDRPGRPGLALDLMEEFRAFLADRLVLSLVNLKQVQGAGFMRTASSGVVMDDRTRKRVLVAYQERKQDELAHPFLGEKTTVGLLFQLQALLLARYLRGDMDAYPSFVTR